ncbi:MAG: hypothetical protein PVH19_14580 [Planctomycetia bacterium]
MVDPQDRFGRTLLCCLAYPAYVVAIEPSDGAASLENRETGVSN